MTTSPELPPRVDALLDAVASVTSDLSLGAVLRRIVASATVLADATYGALGVLSEDGQSLDEFVHVGMPEGLVARIGSLPEGGGLLGAVIESGGTIRLDDLTADPRSGGVPRAHPPMTSFLGLPIRVGDQIFGNLYLTNKRSGTSFTDEDEALVTALAATAGAPVQHARTNEARTSRWLGALRQLTELAGSSDAGSSFASTMLDAAMQVTGADAGLIVAEDGAPLAFTGLDISAAEPVTSLLVTRVVASALSVRSEFADADAAAPFAAGPLLAVPVGTEDETYGVLLSRAGSGTPFGDLEVSWLETLTDHATLVAETVRAREHREAIALLTDRQRIARDLHDTVIQRLFGTGLQLQGLAQLLGEEQRNALMASIDDIDEAIRDIRTAIFTIQAPLSRGSLRDRVQRVSEEAARALGFQPTVRFQGAVDSVATNDVVDAVAAVVREALSNVARHANATAARVDVRSDPSGITVTVEDDGVGFVDTSGGGLGLRNLADRAAGLGGRFLIEANPDGGTRLEWSARIE